VKQDEQSQQEARYTEYDLQDDLKNFHELPFWGAPTSSIGRVSV